MKAQVGSSKISETINIVEPTKDHNLSPNVNRTIIGSAESFKRGFEIKNEKNLRLKL